MECSPARQLIAGGKVRFVIAPTGARAERRKLMKKLLMIAGLLITLCNVGAGVVYACFCIDKYEHRCDGQECWVDSHDHCNCSGEIE
jgi:hypothetical protein